MIARRIVDKENIPNQNPCTVCAIILTAYMDFYCGLGAKPIFPRLSLQTLRLFIAQIKAMLGFDLLINTSWLLDCFHFLDRDSAHDLLLLENLWEPPSNHNNLWYAYLAVEGNFSRPVELSILLVINQKVEIVLHILIHYEDITPEDLWQAQYIHGVPTVNAPNSRSLSEAQAIVLDFIERYEPDEILVNNSEIGNLFPTHDTLIREIPLPTGSKRSFHFSHHLARLLLEGCHCPSTTLQCDPDNHDAFDPGSSKRLSKLQSRSFNSSNLDFLPPLPPPDLHRCAIASAYELCLYHWAPPATKIP